MGYGVYKTYAATMASADSVVSYFNLNRAYAKVYLEIPTMTSSTALDLYAGSTSTAFYQVRKDVPNTTTVQSWTFTIAATAGANGGIVPLPAGFQYYKLVATDSSPTAAVTFKIICGDS